MVAPDQGGASTEERRLAQIKKPNVAKTKISPRQLIESAELFGPLLALAVDVVKAHLQKPLSVELDPDEKAVECASCRGYVNIVIERALGKSIVHHSVQVEQARQMAESLAREFELDPNAVVAIAEELVAKAGQTPFHRG